MRDVSTAPSPELAGPPSPSDMPETIVNTLGGRHAEVEGPQDCKMGAFCRRSGCGAAVLSATSAALHRGVVDGVAGIGVWAGVGVVVSARRCAWSLRGVGAAVVGAPGYWCGGRLVAGWRRGALAG